MAMVNTATKWRHKWLALVVSSINAAVYYLTYLQNPILYQYSVEARVLNVALPYFVVLKSIWNLATQLQLEPRINGVQIRMENSGCLFLT